MGDNPWSQHRKAAKKRRKQMTADYYREIEEDENGKEKYGNKKR